MKLLFENWRKYLNEFAIAPYSHLNRNIKPQKPEEDEDEDGLLKEAAKDVDDLPENWFVKIVRAEDKNIRVELVQLDIQGRFQRIPGRKDPFSVVQAVHSDHPSYGEEYSDLNTYIIQKSSAPVGYGPLLYDIILELAGDDGVTPDQSGIVSNYARNVWDYYDKVRSDVSSQPFGENENDILKKIYKKGTQEKINKLKNAIPPKLIEDDTPTEEPKFVEAEPAPFDPSRPEEWDFLEDLDENIAEKDLKNVSNEDFQAGVMKKHTKMKIRLIGKGGNTKKEGPGIQKPSFKRSKSSPGGFGGA